MYTQTAVKQNPLLRNGAYGIVMRGVQKCICAGASTSERVNITVQMYPCSEGTDTDSPAL